MNANEPHIVSIHRSQEPGQPMLAVETIDVVEDFGFAGDRKGRAGSKRQVLLMDVETISEFGFVPGDLEENITTEGLRVRDLERGQQVRIGDVVLEITIERPTCHKLEVLRPGLGDELAGRRGKMTRVVSGGTIRVGDALSTDD
jgi:MOSC domain-containing protein YiiM